MTWSTLPRSTKPIARMSKRKRREYDDSRPVVEAVFERDGWVCVLRMRPDVAGECFGPLTPHHVLKQSAKRGFWKPEGLVTLCSFHNGTWVEGNRRAAERLGLVVRQVDELRQAWRDMRMHGLTVGPLRVACTGPETTPLRRREIEAGEAGCSVCGHFQPILADPSGGPVLAAHEVDW